jgi:hypothetical protein
MDLKEIQALIKFVAKSGAQEVSLETEDFKINIKTASEGSDQPTIIQAVAPQAAMPVAAAPAPAAGGGSCCSCCRSSSRGQQQLHRGEVSNDWNILPQPISRPRCFRESRF